MTPMAHKKAISIFTTDEGHKSIAQAAAEALDQDYEVSIFHHRDNSLDLYMPFYQLFPNLFKIPFHIGQNAKLTPLLHNMFRKRMAKLLYKYFHQAKPDLMINTYFMFSPVLEDIQDEYQVPFINLLTDPKSVHSLVISEKAVVNVAFDTNQVALCTSMNDRARYKTLGWFVRDQFEQPYDKVEVRKKLRLHPKKLTFLVASGSEGTALIMKILGLLLEPNEDLQLIIACGNNKNLFKAVKLIARMLKQTRNKTKIVPLSFTNKLHEYIQAADLVVGKAGPNTLFESVATLTPFFAITHIAGQEDGNLDIIREYKLGYVEENPLKATQILQQIINNPAELDQFIKPLQKMSAHNKKAKEQLRQTVKKHVQ